MKKSLNFYEWLTNEDYGNECKQRLVKIYEEYFETTDKKQKDELFKQLEIYLSVVCDVIAYRYLVKYYTNLFYKLCITVEDYMDYKVKRLLTTIKDKKEHIDDILSYIYMSFMLSSPRLIYDYAEKIGRCKLVKENLPYYQVARNKFFTNEKEEDTEHYIYSVDTLYFDEYNEDDSNQTKSNIDKYSYSDWKNKKRMEDDGLDKFKALLEDVEYADDYSENSRKYLLNLFKNWKTEIESDYNNVKLQMKAGNSYSILDYIKYKYENSQTDLTKNEYIDVLKLINKLLKGE